MGDPITTGGIPHQYSVIWFGSGATQIQRTSASNRNNGPLRSLIVSSESVVDSSAPAG